MGNDYVYTGKFVKAKRSTFPCDICRRQTHVVHFVSVKDKVGDLYTCENCLINIFGNKVKLYLLYRSVG